MTGLIGSLVGAASTAVERIAGLHTAKGVGGKDGTAGEFASLLATMTGGGSAAAVASARPKEFRLGMAEVEEGVTADAAAPAAGVEVALIALPIQPATRPVLTAVDAAAEEVGAVAEGEAESGRSEAEAELTEAELAAELDPALEVVNVNEVEKDLDGLQPEFRRRLDRVIERMEAEFGHKVTIVETVRTQERQNHLYAQGRTRPGPVVTWTRNSNHLKGRAVDVMIDGSYQNPRGYERLAQIAAEEGLRTLGPRDAGHIELPRGVDGGGQPMLAGAESRGLPELAAIRDQPPIDPSRARQVGGIARVAEVAQVAQVADVARVAEVARVADPTRPVFTAPAPAADASAAALAARFTGAESGNSGGRQREGQRETATSVEMEMLRSDPGMARGFASNAITEASFTGGTDAVQRAAQILAMKEGAANAPVNHLLLRLDSPTGGVDRIRVDLRGTTVDTTLNIGNANEAEQLASKVGELRQSLERHGLEAEAVKIRTTQPLAADRVEGVRATLAGAEIEGSRQGSGSRSGSDSAGARDNWKEAQEQLRREPGDPRHRSRREQPKEEKA